MLESELDAFRDACLKQNVKTIIESGRGRWAVSTRYLGAFGKAHGIEVISIDWEQRFVNKWISRFACRNSGVTWLVGNAEELMPACVAESPSPIALFVDGPKHSKGLCLLKRSLWPSVKVIALHNCTGTTWGQFVELFPQAKRTGELGIAYV